jgi:hypothetical protein
VEILVHIYIPTQLVAFIGSIGIMEGRNTKQISKKYSDMYMPALFANWKVWPLAQVSIAVCSPTIYTDRTPLLQLINFRYMSLPYRVPFQSTCGVFWTLYLSILNSKYVCFQLWPMHYANPGAERARSRTRQTHYTQHSVKRSRPSAAIVACGTFAC